MTMNRSAKITFAHINDTHSHFEPSSISLTLPEEVLDSETSVYASCGGFSRVSSAVKDVKMQAHLKGREFMFVHAGDCFQGTLFFSLYKGLANAKLLNAIGIEAMALGNHELDMGNGVVADFLDSANFPMLVANWDLASESQSKPNPLREKNNIYAYDSAAGHGRYIVKDVDGEPVAVFGLAIENMAGIANPDPDTFFLNVVDVANKTIAAIHQQGINKIVLLSHLGYDRDLELAAQVKGLGAIIGGHSHTMQGDFTNVGYGVSDEYAKMVSGTCVVQAGCNALALGQLELDFNPDGSVASASGVNQLLLGRQFTVDATRSEHLDDDSHEAVKQYLTAQENIRYCAKDPVIENILNTDYRPAVRQLQTQHIAEAAEPLRHVRIPDHKGGSQIAPLVVESFVWQGRQLGHDVDFGIHNAGGVRSSLNPGPITSADIAGKLLPFAIGLMVYQVKGIRVREALEGAINNAIDNGVEGTGSGSFPYTSNLRFTYRCCADEGQRIENLQTIRNGLWVDIEDDETYTSVSSGYTATGKEGYGALLEYEREPQALNVTMADAFELYAKEVKILSPQENSLISYIPCGCEQVVA
ncbi:bifunctional metallophosphatase/5'-nucleotidase [Photobacterium sp. SDRW27]|uniref:bifunctional metallophosphatase/5'-nucleotidase n=1 Tax=Photobacterium obscurum TaxID=2829490 RepID=UPI002242FE0F|nr:bifunctional UDP-sugar hydrolase/5'-nucleotidase [Photobacterium obscurum]MCW8329367.1 bifunctional metallophosphatase/5'-nucleotidase [Photobacterium obscurum]